MFIHANTLARVVAISLAIANFSKPALAQKSLHEVESSAALSALDKKDYAEALRHSNRCIEEFRGAATMIQKNLDNEQVEVPKGQASPQQKEKILKNGPLNDVATCYFVKGLALDKLGRREESVKAFVAAQELSKARCWDPKGWFWSPAEASLKALVNPETVSMAPHEALTAEAWGAFNKGDFKKAGELADESLKHFYVPAVELQKNLIERGEKVPPTGPVAEDLKRAIFQNGLINDVASIAYIKGRSAEGMGDTVGAARAYRVAIQLHYGRCWDSGGWFWSPAKGASERLENLR